MPSDNKLFLPKDTACPVCHKQFTRYLLKKKQFSLDKRDIDYRPVYLGSINPRYYSVSVCPHCYYAAEDKFFCPEMSEDERRRKELLDSHRSQWEVASRVRAASSGQQVWKDIEAEKFRDMTKSQVSILRQISPLLKRVVSAISEKEKPYNELQKDGDLEAAIRSWELAAICLKARRANHRIMGYTYLSAAWTARDAYESTSEPVLKERFKDFENAYLTEAVSFLTISNKSTGVEDVYMPDGILVQKENIPQTRVFEIMYILAGSNRMLGRIEESNFFLEQIIYGSKNAQGVILWFVNQAREMRHEAASTDKNASVFDDESENNEE